MEDGPPRGNPAEEDLKKSPTQNPKPEIKLSQYVRVVLKCRSPSPKTRPRPQIHTPNLPPSRSKPVMDTPLGTPFGVCSFPLWKARLLPQRKSQSRSMSSPRVLAWSMI